LERILLDNIDRLDGLSVKIWTEDKDDIRSSLVALKKASKKTFIPAIADKILSIKIVKAMS